MRTADADILIIPGWSGSGAGHWQTRWESRLKTARRVEQADWLAPDRQQWIARIDAAIAAATRPVVLVAHSLGVMAAVHALAAGPPRPAVAGAFLVAPADIDNAQAWPVTHGMSLAPGEGGFAPVPLTKLPCPSAVVASSNDPCCSLDRARGMADAWGAKLFEAGAAGHINTESGHGPWPEGLMQFGWFMRTLA